MTSKLNFGKACSSLWPWGLWAIAVLASWYPLFYRGQIPVDGSLMRGAFPNWAFAHSLSGSFQWMLWNPYCNMGEPFLADPQTMAAYPVSWLLNRLNGFHLFLCVWFAAHAGVSAFFSFRLGLRWFSDRTSAGVTAMIASLNPFFTSLVTAPNQFASAAYLPAALYFLMIDSVPGLAVALALQWLAGFPPYSALTLLSLLILAIGSARACWWSFLKGVLIALGLSALQWIPFIELLTHASHPLRMGRDLFSAPHWFIPATLLLALLGGAGLSKIKGGILKAGLALFVLLGLVAYSPHTRLTWTLPSFLEEAPPLALKLTMDAHIVPIRLYYPESAMESSLHFLSSKTEDLKVMKEALVPSLGMGYDVREIASLQTLKLKNAELLLDRMSREGPSSPLLQWAGAAAVMTPDLHVVEIAKPGSVIFFPKPGSERSVLCDAAKPGYYKANVVTRKDEEVAVAEMEYPGWQFTRDGEKIPHFLFEGAWMAVRVPPGATVLEARFDSKTFRWGLLVSLLSLLGLAVACRRRVARFILPELSVIDRRSLLLLLGSLLALHQLFNFLNLNLAVLIAGLSLFYGCLSLSANLSVSMRTTVRRLLLAGIIFAFVFRKSNPLVASYWHIPGLPLIGLAYLGLKLISVTLDVASQQTKNRSWFSYLCYCLFAPTYLAGPLFDYRFFRNQLALSLSARERSDLLLKGARRVIQGLFKTVVLSFITSHYTFFTWPEQSLLRIPWYQVVAIIDLTFMDLYFNFSGYTDLAIGIANCLGISMPENFNYPFVSRNLREFWSRWHITLADWFRLYIFSPVYRRLLRWRSFQKNPSMAVAISVLITFLLMGVWHGLQWNYLAYGLMHGVGVLTYLAFSRRFQGRTERGKGFQILSDLWARVLTFHYLALALLVFYADSPDRLQLLWNVLRRAL